MQNLVFEQKILLVERASVLPLQPLYYRKESKSNVNVTAVKRATTKIRQRD